MKKPEFLTEQEIVHFTHKSYKKLTDFMDAYFKKHKPKDFVLTGEDYLLLMAQLHQHSLLAFAKKNVDLSENAITTSEAFQNICEYYFDLFKRICIQTYHELKPQNITKNN